MMPFLMLPNTSDFIIRGAHVPAFLTDGAPSAGLVDSDIQVSAGQVAAVGPSLPPSSVSVAAAGSIVIPGFVDMHTHLDKGQIWPRAANRDGTHLAAQLAVKADRESNWTAEDVAARAGFGLRCAYAHGTVAIRTHLDSLGEQLRITWPVFRRLREEWSGRIALQGVSLVPLDVYATPFVEEMADVVAEAGGLLGGSGALQPDAPALIRRVFDLAADRDLDIDLHVDETGDPAAHTLRLIAQETIRRGYQGRVTCGHCCSLAAQDPADAAETIALVADAGLTIVSLPMVNLYLQGRRGGTPLWRGITLLHELRAAGVRVILASDNTRDPVLRLRRSRLGRGVPRGGAYRPSGPASRPVARLHHHATGNDDAASLWSAAWLACRLGAVLSAQLQRIAVPPADRSDRAEVRPADRHHPAELPRA